MRRAISESVIRIRSTSLRQPRGTRERERGQTMEVVANIVQWDEMSTLPVSKNIRLVSANGRMKQAERKLLSLAVSPGLAVHLLSTSRAHSAQAHAAVTTHEGIIKVTGARMPADRSGPGVGADGRETLDRRLRLAFGKGVD